VTGPPSHLHDVGAMAAITNASSNLGASFILGLAAGGSDSVDPSNFGLSNKALKTVYFKDGDEALNYLKTVIASNHPVLVFLDHTYIYDDFAKVSSYWKSSAKPSSTDFWISSFFTVTGYDEEYIYINDPGDPTQAGTDLPTKVENFKLAWGKSGQGGTNLNTNNLGPYWMFYLTQLGNRKSVDDIIAWNATIGKDVPTEIMKFSANPINSTVFQGTRGHLSIGRAAFADYLDKNGKANVATLYRQSSSLLWSFSLPRNITSANLTALADLERQALVLLQGK
jgi:hypothetical protein